jgi:hypothetical protein
MAKIGKVGGEDRNLSDNHAPIARTDDGMSRNGGRGE